MLTCPTDRPPHTVQSSACKPSCEKVNSGGFRGPRLYSREPNIDHRATINYNVCRRAWRRGKFNHEQQQQAPAAVPPSPSPAVGGDLRRYCSAGGSLSWNSPHIPGLDGGQEKGGSCGSPSRKQQEVQHQQQSLSFLLLHSDLTTPHLSTGDRQEGRASSGYHEVYTDSTVTALFN